MLKSLAAVCLAFHERWLRHCNVGTGYEVGALPSHRFAECKFARNPTVCGVTACQAACTELSMSYSDTQPHLQVLDIAGMPVDDTEEGSWGNRASQALRQPLQDDSRQHSWTAGRPSPKYRPPPTPPSLMSSGATLMPHTSLQTLSEEDSTYAQTPSDHACDQPALFSYPPLAGPTHRRPSTSDSTLMPSVTGAAAMPHQPAPPFPPPSATGGPAQQVSFMRDSPYPRPVSPFETTADLPFTPPQRVSSIMTSHHTDRVHFEENPLFVPLESHDGTGCRWVHFQLLL